MNKKDLKDSILKKIIIGLTMITIISLASILVFIILKSVPLLKNVNLLDFIFSSNWAPQSGKFGIKAFIICSFITTILAVLIGIPIGLFTAIFISDIAPKRIKKWITFAIEILAAIPSVIYGFFGLTVIVPIVQKIFNLQSGSTLFSASIILSFMIIPTVVSLSTSALNSVPKSIDEGSLALGATKIQTIFKVKLKYAKSGILASFVLGIGRALGETMAVILVAGNSVLMPKLSHIFTSIFEGGRTLTGNIVLELQYASGVHESALFATGLILFIIVCILNIIILFIKKRGVNNE